MNEKAGDNDMRKKIALKADPVLIDFFASIDDDIQAFESENHQAQYGDIGGLWAPQQFAQDHSPDASTFQLSESANAQSQIQKQLEQTEKMFASAGFSLQQPGSILPAPLSNQSSFNGYPNNSLPDATKIPANPFNGPPAYNSSQSYQQAQPLNAYQQPGNNYPQSFGANQVPFGQPLNSGAQQFSLPNQPSMFQSPQPFGSAAPQSFAPMNPFSANDAGKKPPSASPFNPFGAAPNPSNQAMNFQNFGNNTLQNPAMQLQPQVLPYSIPRNETAIPVQANDLFGDLATLDLNPRPAENKMPFDPFSGNLNPSFGGQQNFINTVLPQQTFAPTTGKGMPNSNAALNPFGVTQNVVNPPAPVGIASNPFDFGGNLRTASNNYIVGSSVQPPSLFEPRTAAGAPGMNSAPKPSQNQDLFAQDPFAMPFKANSNSPFEFK